MELITYLLLAIAGLVWGSFLGALTWRYPRRISVKRGRSFCPNCKKKIAWFDNLPLISFLFLAGRCRNCQQKISWRYPVIELTTCLGFVGIGLLRGNFLLYSLFLLTLAILIIDIENQIIPDELIFFGLILVFISFLLGDYQYLFIHLASGFAAGVFLLMIHLVTFGRGMGLGDVKLAILGGLVLGWPAALVWFFSAFIFGALIGLILILFKKASFGQKIAFGPYLVIGLWFTILMVK